MEGRGPAGDVHLSRRTTLHAALVAVGVLGALAMVSCAPEARTRPEPPPAAPSAEPRPAATAAPTPSDAAASQDPGRRPRLGTRRPSWLGRRVLPRTADGYGEIRPTPPVLRARGFPTVDLLPPPPTTDFVSTVERVPDDVAGRSTWSPECPVGLDDLRYLTVSFWGFDDRVHTGELLVHRDMAHDVVTAFRRLHRARFPMEEMRVVDAPELDLPPTGDGNNTTAFVCRPVRGSTSWSQHAYGRAVDVNPFFNPYVKDEVVLPELASYFTTRDRGHPGMHVPGGPSVRAFDRIGWKWGGTWTSPKDWMHFSATGG